MTERERQEWLCLTGSGTAIPRWWLAVAALAAADSQDFLLLSSRQEKTMHNPAAQSNRDHRTTGQ